jgi:predicted DNA binding CopG/RHH family protein
MKVKILLVPLFLVISIILVIWLVYPAYIDLKLKNKELSEVKNKVSDMDLKLQKTIKLMSTLNENTEEQRIIYDFLPDSQKEEDVIDSLNNIASSEGVSIAALSVERPKVSLKSIQTTEENSLGNKGFTPSAKIKNFEVSFKILGNYEKIKNVIKKINQAKRFNEINYFAIAKNNGQEASSELLSLNLIMNFNYLEKIKSVSLVDNKIFSSGKFNTATLLEDLAKYRAGYVSRLTVGETGKSNPFLP